MNNDYDYMRALLNHRCDAGFNHHAAPCPVHQPEYAIQRPLGFGYRVEWKGGGWEVNGCVSYAEAARKVAEWAEKDGVPFRRYWWQFWRPVDPREVYPS